MIASYVDERTDEVSQEERWRTQMQKKSNVSTLVLKPAPVWASPTSGRPARAL